jgi:hypothetical protein
MIEVVYASGTDMVHLSSGYTARVQKGSHWPATDPVVRARPDLFSDDPRYGMLYTVEPDGYDAPVAETATAAPGEQRGRVRRG